MVDRKLEAAAAVKSLPVVAAVPELETEHSGENLWRSTSTLLSTF
jgi:hypothetical protein